MEIKDSIETVLRAEEHEVYSSRDFYEKPIKNIHILQNIYHSEKGKENFMISAIFNYNNPYYSYLGFEFLLRAKEIKKAFEYFEKSLNKVRTIKPIYFSEYYSLFNKCLARLNFLINDARFNVKEIELIRNYVLDLTRLFPRKHLVLKENYYANKEILFNHEIRKQIIRKLELKKAELISELYNEDILKEDIKAILEKIKKMDLGNEIGIAFKKLEEKYYEAEDKNDFAMFGGYIRQALMSLVKQMALKISKNKGELVKEKDEHYRNYLKSAGVINEGLWRMIGALYDFLSIEINHNIETDREYYKRGLNIASQLSCLLLKEYEKFTQNKHI